MCMKLSCDMGPKDHLLIFGYYQQCLHSLWEKLEHVKVTRLLMSIYITPFSSWEPGSTMMFISRENLGEEIQFASGAYALE